MTKHVKVSILCLTFNQEQYIRDTLDGFLMQQTDFVYEVLINDDASTDGTQKIIKEYQNKYPDVIKPVFQKTNLYSRGQRNFIPRFLIPRAQGEYLAICEGDDYWTDSKKLQKQVDFLDAHPDYSICFHAVNVKFEGAEGKDYIFPDVPKLSWYTNKELLRTNYIPTNSVMYRKLSYEDLPVNVNISPADWFLHLYHARYGKIKFINKIMSVYRKHERGMWWEYDVNRDKIWRQHGVAHIAMHHQLLNLYKDDQTSLKIIRDNLDRLMDTLVKVDKRYDDTLIESVLTKFPEIGAVYIQKLRQDSRVQHRENQKLWKAVHDQDELLRQKEEMIQLKQTELNQIRKDWKYRVIRRLPGGQKHD